MNRRRAIAITLLLAVLLAAAWGVVTYINSFQIARIKLNGSATLTVYASANNHDDPLEYKADQPVATITSSQDIKLKKGTYVVASTKNPDVRDVLQTFSLADQPVDVPIRIEYSKEKLAGLLQRERQVIQSALNEQLPRLATYYRVARESLYNSGDWYGAVLSYTGPSSTIANDSLRVIAQKRDGSWRVVTFPPQIVISIEQYPSIPPNVIRHLNNQL